MHSGALVATFLNNLVYTYKCDKDLETDDDDAFFRQPFSIDIAVYIVMKRVWNLSHIFARDFYISTFHQ